MKALTTGVRRMNRELHACLSLLPPDFSCTRIKGLSVSYDLSNKHRRSFFLFRIELIELAASALLYPQSTPDTDFSRPPLVQSFSFIV